MPPRVSRRSASQNASNSSENPGVAAGAMQLDIESEVVEPIVEQSPTNSVGNASPALVVQSPSRMNINLEVNLNRAIRDAKLARDKLTEVSATDMNNEDIKKDKSLTLLRAYLAVDSELDTIESHGKYTPDVIAARRSDNIKTRNEYKGTVNDNIWKAFLSASVENHRV